MAVYDPVAPDSEEQDSVKSNGSTSIRKVKRKKIKAFLTSVMPRSIYHVTGIKAFAGVLFYHSSVCSFSVSYLC